MKKISLALALLLLCTLAIQAQTKKPSTAPAKTGTKTGATTKEAPAEEAPAAPSNLVLDSSFELDDVKLLKSYGQLPAMIKNWGSPNAANADLFNTMAKSTKVAAPKNDLGTEEPFEGSGYGGFRAFTKDPKKTRSYLQTRLTKKLAKDKLYCVRFNVSLSDLSKWGANNVGMFISDRKVQNTNSNALTFQPQITEKTNVAITTMSGWETICGTYLATGREEYIIIGCFGIEADIKLEKVIKPVSQEGMIMPDAYYYIDNVEIVEIVSQGECFCGKKEDKDPDLIYSRASAKNVDMKPAEMVKATSVWFSYLSAEIPSMFEQELLEIAKLLEENPTMKLDLVGHSDNDEQNETKTNKNYIGLAQTRAESVKKFLTDNGVAASRITVSGKDNTVPASDKATPMGKAQNRRVEFSAK